MFCPNCGNKCSNNSSFCGMCGHKINSKMTTTEKLAHKFPIKKFFNKFKNFILFHKKKFIIGSLSVLFLAIGITMFYLFYDFTKLTWDNEYEDSKIIYTSQTTLSLNVLAYDKNNEKIDKIKFKSDGGTVEYFGTEVTWKLPYEEGKYTITAIAPSGKKIKKQVEVIKLDSDILTMESEEQEDNIDSDQDGLSDLEEKELGTNPYTADSDSDGISDYYEINQTKTDPLKADTDADGINDGDELDLNLNPLASDSNGDGISDGKRRLEYNIDNNLGVNLSIVGSGNIASTTVDILSNTTFETMDGVLNKVYNFYTEGILESATVSIKYSLEELEQKGLNEDNLTIYYFNEEKKTLDEIPTIVDKENKLLIVNLTHFSKYVIGDKNIVLTNKEVQVMFVIDNSVSMYSEKQMIKAGYNDSVGAIGNDTSFKRLTLTNNMVDMFTGNYKFGVAEFSGNYVSLQTFTNDINKVKTSINSMKSKWHSNANGTNIISALEQSINSFSEDKKSHYVILLTDGRNTEGDLSEVKDSIINSALKKKVNVCVIGIGSQVDSEDLDNIAERTGCDYYNATDAGALDEIYSLVGAGINYNYVDTDSDNKTDALLLSNSGFLVKRDGFSFANFVSNKSIHGHCYGMATFAMLYYTKALPFSLESAHKHTIFKNFEPANGYNLENTYFSDYNKLYDYKPKSQALNIILNDIPSDYRDRIENGNWLIKKNYYNQLAKIGVTFSFKEYKGKNKDIKKYQSALLNLDSNDFYNNTDKQDNQILNSIYRLFILQVNHKTASFSSEPDEAFKTLKQNLEDGIPVVSVVNGNHAVNAIRLLQDDTNANEFKIEIYDNNYPGKTRYIEVSRHKYSKWQLNFTAWTNEYEYKFKYDTDNDGQLEDVSFALSSAVIE